jgi:hypothetical protein
MPENWQNLTEAATRLNRNASHVRRLCQKWAAEGKARKMNPETGGKPQWFIRSDVTLPGKPAEPAKIVATSFDTSRLTKLQQNDLFRRENIVRGWMGERDKSPARGKKRTKRADSYLLSIAAKFGAMSRANLYRLTAAYERSGLAGLLDGRVQAALRKASAATPGGDTADAATAGPTTQAHATTAAAAIGTKTDEQLGFATLAIQTSKGAIRIILPAGVSGHEASKIIQRFFDAPTTGV